MQILEIYIHTIHIHSYTYIYNFFHHHHHHPPPPTPPTPQGGGGVLIHSYTYIYNFFHHHHHHPPPPTPPTPQGGGGYTTTHHHPHYRGEGGYWGATIQTHNHGVGGGGRVPSDAGPYIDRYMWTKVLLSPKQTNDAHKNTETIDQFRFLRKRSNQMMILTIRINNIDNFFAEPGIWYRNVVVAAVWRFWSVIPPGARQNSSKYPKYTHRKLTNWYPPGN